MTHRRKHLFPKRRAQGRVDDYVIRCLCYAFGTSRAAIAARHGNAFRQVNQESAEKEGLEPWLDWAEKCVLAPMIQRYLAFPDYEATYAEDTDVDPEKTSVIDASDVKVGIRHDQ